MEDFSALVKENAVSGEGSLSFPLKYKVRAGTIDFGKEYELNVVALLSLRCIMNEGVDNMWIAFNADESAAFDDVILTVEFSRGLSITYMIQLKHQERPRPIRNEEFTAPRGNFSLQKYLDDIAQLSRSTRSSSSGPSVSSSFNRIYFIIFTNRGKYDSTVFEDYSGDDLLSLVNTGKTSILDPSRGSNYINLYLFYNQLSVKDMDKVFEDMIKYYLNHGQIPNNVIQQIIKNFKDYIAMWAKGDLGGHYRLTKRDVVDKLAELYFSQYETKIQENQFNGYTFPGITIWKEIISGKTITVIKDNKSDIRNFIIHSTGSEVANYCNLLDGLWTDLLSLEEKSLFYRRWPDLKQQMLKIIGNKGQISLLDIYKCLWIVKQCPLVLEINSVDDYQNILCILKKSNYNYNIIILIKNELELPYNSIERFVTLNDLNPVKQENILTQFVKLQGRRFSMLRDLIDESMYEFITCRDIIHILTNKFNIGNMLEPLPDYFIRRRTRKIFLKATVLEKVTNEIFLLSNCTEEYIGQLKATKLEEIDFNDIPDMQIIIVQDDYRLEQLGRLIEIRKPIHHLSFYNQLHLHWKWSWGTTKNIRRYGDILDDFETDISEYFLNNVTIISEVPGMGKSTLMNYIANHAPPTKWVIRIDLLQHLEYFKREECKHEETTGLKHLEYFFNGMLTNKELDKRIYNKLLEEKKIIVIMDGFDEVSKVFKVEATNIGKSLINTGFSIWLTTQPHNKVHLEKQFDTFAISMEPFTDEERQEFLIKYLEAKYSSYVSQKRREEFTEALLKNVITGLNESDSEIARTPLLLKLLVDHFSETLLAFEKSSNPIILNTANVRLLYQDFVDRKKEGIRTLLKK